jgi:hypothetical protein
LFDAAAPSQETAARPTIEQRFTAFSAANHHVIAEALRLARVVLDRGDRYLSVKAILEQLRVSVESTGDSGYRINNDFSAPLARLLCELEPRLVPLIRTRTRSAK